ncbi:MAG: hypothetical protein ACTHZ8_01535 [Microbacterium gubbeenense]|uniref:hypothetical protein n=1 Tax=Microbacterium gubbeenense TaxID=159896 RepID=UPI003F95F031
MKKKNTLGASLILAGALVVGAPIAAQAAPYPVPAPTPAGTVSIAPGATAPVSFTGFAANETVTFTLTGENASGATLASFVRFAVESIDTAKTSDGEGSVSVDVTLPADAVGTYALTATGATSGISQTVTIDTGVATGGQPGPGGLSPTGADDGSVLGILVGGGALLLAGGTVVTAIAVRRRQVAQG